MSILVSTTPPIATQSLSTLLEYGGQGVALLIGTAFAIAIILGAVAKVIQATRE